MQYQEGHKILSEKLEYLSFIFLLLLDIENASIYNN